MALVELVVAIVIFSMSIASIAALLSASASRSAHLMSQAQATSIAAAYLNDILAKTFDNVDDYNGLDHPSPRDQFGNIVGNLNQHRVQVAVSNALLGAPPNDVAALRVDVTVTAPSGEATVVSGYRTDYAGQIIY